MAKSERDDSVHDEPHMRASPAEVPPSPEHSVLREAEGAPSAQRPGSEDAALHSVHDEPGIFPETEPRLIDRDWTCGKCGYNLRGLEAGRRCPECGQIELYRPPPPGARGYAHWLWDKASEAKAWHVWAAVAGATLVGGLLGVIGTFFTISPLGMPFGGKILQSVLMAPPVEEVMKLAAAALLVERMPYLVRSRSQLLLVGLGSGLGFAVIENILYLTVYINSPSLFLVLWRWIVCTALHVTCTYIAVCGLAKVWERTVREGRPPRMSLAGGALITAIVIHGAYNAGA
ncbi:MAG: PrsW family intramembrane metalloprotease, partial [Planctomycetes bacterium]|nr:PrsW family intramembrane metalloprotease [Planctomycetota bacterium]